LKKLQAELVEKEKTRQFSKFAADYEEDELKSGGTGDIELRNRSRGAEESSSDDEDDRRNRDNLGKFILTFSYLCLKFP